MNTKLIFMIIPILFCGCNKDTSENREVFDAEWKVREIGITGLTLESPFEFRLIKPKMPYELKALIKETYGYEYMTTQFAVMINYMIYLDGIDGNLEEAALGAIKNLKKTDGISDFTYEISDIYKDGLNGKLLKGQYDIKNQRIEFCSVMFVQNPKMWSVICLYVNSEENRKITDKIISSVSIYNNVTREKEHGTNDKKSLIIPQGKLLKKLNMDLPIECLKLSYDQKLIAIGDYTEDPLGFQELREKFRVKIIKADNYLIKYELSGHKDALQAIDFSYDNEKLVSADREGTIILWNLITGEKINTIKSKKWVDNVKFLADGKTFIAIHGVDKKALVYSVEGNLINTLEVRNQINDFEINTKKDKIYFGCFDEIQVWSLSTFKKISDKPFKGIMCIKMDHNKERIAIGLGSGDIVILYDNLNEMARYFGHFKPVMDISFSFDDRFLGSASSDQTARIWDLENKKEIIQLVNEHKGSVKAIEFVSGNRFITGGENKELKIWE